MMSPVVSVIMPVHNAESWLQRSVGSVLSQSFKEFELICFDDASTDLSLQILQGFACADKRVRVIHSDVNVKQGAGRNRGIQEALGIYIMFVDADDAIAPNAIEHCVKTAITNNSEAVFFDYMRLSTNLTICQLGEDASTLRDDDLRIRIAQRQTPIWSAMYARRLFRDNKLLFPEGVYYEDNAIALALQLSADNPIKLNEALYYYRSDNISVTRSSNNLRFFDRIGSAIAMFNHCHRLSLYENFSDEIDYVFFNQYLVHTVYGAIYRFDKVQTDQISHVVHGVRKYIGDYHKNKYYKASPIRQRFKLWSHIVMPRFIKFLSNINRKLSN